MNKIKIAHGGRSYADLTNKLSTGAEIPIVSPKFGTPSSDEEEKIPDKVKSTAPKQSIRDFLNQNKRNIYRRK